MYPASFEYHAPSTIAEAVALLSRHGEDAKLLAGSQSLVPLMKFRLATPAHVIDLRKVPGITGIREEGGALIIGALTTHRTIERSEDLRKKLPILPEAAAFIGDPQVRNQGTIGGSLAHADPSADWPAVTTALDATVTAVGKSGERTLKISDLIVGPLTNSLNADEILVSVRIPLPPAKSGSAYEKEPHPASRFAVVGVAVALQLDAKGVVQQARVAVTGLGSKVTRAGYVEQALTGKTPDPGTLKAAAARTAEGIEIRGDNLGSPAYKTHLASVIAERALRKAAARAVER
jgi:aerobic carbon-monoxide dehydrogenase medium subunit